MTAALLKYNKKKWFPSNRKQPRHIRERSNKEIINPYERKYVILKAQKDWAVKVSHGIIIFGAKSYFDNIFFTQNFLGRKKKKKEAMLSQLICIIDLFAKSFLHK